MSMLFWIIQAFLFGSIGLVYLHLWFMRRDIKERWTLRAANILNLVAIVTAVTGSILHWKF